MSTKPTFTPVEANPDFVAHEEGLLRLWYDEGIVEDYLHQHDDSDKRFSFLDGPITANNPMGVHHAWGRTYKDLWQRWYAMQGYAQRFQNGFDCQGLWVEVEVEKELGFKNKKDIEKFGIDKFVELCKERVRKFAGIQTEQTKRLGNFMDWANSYYTMSDENNYMIWAFLKKVYESKYLYKGHDSVPWCPRCGTAISQHEILTENYQEITHQSVYVKYPLRGKKNEFLLVWTTTPWTIPANVAVAVNPEFTYAKIQQAGQTYYLAEALVDQAMQPGYQRVGKIAGKDLIGWEYDGPYDELPAVKKALSGYTHRIVAAPDLVTATEGTGLVHIAPGAGEEDFKLGQEEKLPVIASIDDESFYYDGFGEFTGKSAKDNPELILDDLGRRGFSYRVQDYKHAYPVCWRCRTELVWRVVDEWYISMDNLRDKIAANARKVNWNPKFGLDRELDWLKNMHDWLVSKKRYWGLALPIWECDCGEFQVIGSYEELKQQAAAGWDKFEGHSPHRPWIDEVKLTCPKCGKLVSRIKDVGNPWLDAGIVPFSTLNYQAKTYWQKWYPADFVTESFPGQFKNWFYSLLTMATVMDDSAPFKNLLGYGTLLAEDGRPMHKSSGNSIEFNEAAGKVGADAMRWVYLKHNPENNLLFGWNRINEAKRSFLLLLWNVYKFFIDYALLDNWTPVEIASTNVLDRWIDSRFNQTLETVNSSLAKYDPLHAAEAIEALVQDFSTWWLRRSRDRMGPWATNIKDKEQAYATFYWTLHGLARMLAPFVPFVADSIYRNLTGERSVHLSTWPEVGEIDQELLSEMALARLIVEKSHSLRKDKGVKLRQPLTSLTYSFDKPLSSEIEQVVAQEANVKGLIFKKSKPELLVSMNWELTPELENEGQARELIRRIQDARKELKLDRQDKVSVALPDIPEGWSERIAKATQATEIKTGEFKVTPVKT